MGKVMKKFFGFLVALAILIYVGGIIFFTSNTYPNTTVNGEKRGLLSKSDMFSQGEPDLEVVLKDNEGKDYPMLSRDIDYTREVKGTPTDNQNAFLWPIQILKNHDYNVDINVRYDEDKLISNIENQAFYKNQVEAENAHIKFNEQTNELEIIDEKYGTTLDSRVVATKVIEAFGDGGSEINLSDLYAKPEITKDSPEFKEELENMKAMTEHNYIFDFEDRKYELTGKKLYDLYDETEDGYEFNTDKLRDYVIELAKETDTYNTKRKFNATDIGEITVPGGIYGWQMNVKKTVNNVLAMMEENSDGPVEIEYNVKGTNRETNDIGDTYLEVDLSRQTVWYYKDGKLDFTTPIVSGNASVRNAATPTGVNVVWTKERDKNLIGTNEMTGEKYDVPVKYWMNVGWTGSGFHDTDYRTEYGGDIYLTKGSSSCMNTPPEAMKILFEKVSVGTPVVIYESSTSYSPTEFEKQEINRERAEA